MVMRSASGQVAMGYITLGTAARALKVTKGQLLAWNMVLVLTRGGQQVVPQWCVDPLVVRVMPLLSEVFSGEALDLCLTTMRPYGDARNGIDALKAQDWALVLPMLRDFRRKFDQFLRAERVADWLSSVGGGDGGGPSERRAPLLI